MIKIIYAMMNHRKDESFEDHLIFGPGEYEIMIFQTPVWIEVDGEMQPYPAHTCILYEPGQIVHYRSQKGDLVYDWIRFDCDEPLYTEDFLPFGVPVYCSNYNGFIVYWQAVANENYWQHPSSNYIIQQLMHIIFQRLHDYDTLNTDSPYQVTFSNLRSKIMQHPEIDWTLELMAKEVNMSIRSLQKYYQEFFHVSCMNEVIASRIDHAKLFLLRTNDSILEISKKCGYKNMEHFCRQFKEKTGMSPSRFRLGSFDDNLDI